MMAVEQDTVGATRRALIAAGYRPVPVLTNQKRPQGFAWTKAAREGRAEPVAPSSMNTGILCDGLRVIDIDIDDENVCAAIHDLAISMFGETPTRYRDNAARVALLYRAAQGEPVKAAVTGDVGKVEILGYGQQFVAYGGHPSGAALQWRPCAPHEWARDDLPAIDDDQARAFLDACRPIIGAHTAEPRAMTFHKPAPATLDTPIEEVEELLTYIPSSCAYHDWVEILMAIHAETGGSQEGFQIADQWSSGGASYKGTAEVWAKWRSFKAGGVSGRTIAQRARENGADLSAIAVKHKLIDFDADEAKMIADNLLASFMRKAGVRQLEERGADLVDIETGEVVDVEVPAEAPMGAEIDYPPGLCGAIARWIVATSRRHQPELAIGAALSIVGTLAGRQYAGPTGSATHLYVLGLAPTGTGKDHALQQINRILTQCKLSNLLGPSEFISMPAVVNFLVRKPLSVCCMDEFGGFMKRINGRNASGFEGAISKVLRTMWSTSFAPYITPEWAQRQSETIHCPAITIYGVSTPEQFYQSMEEASLEDGTLNRFLLINGQETAKEVVPDLKKEVVPESIRSDCGVIFHRDGDLSGSWRNDFTVDPSTDGKLRNFSWCPDGSYERYMQFSEAMNAKARHPETGAFYARTAEMAVRIATIIAIGRLDDDQVRISDLEYGMSMALASAQMMEHGASNNIAKNETQANAQRIMRIIRKRGGAIGRRELVRALQNSMKTRDLNETMSALVEGGQIELQEVKNPRGKSTVRYQVIGEER